MEQRFCFVFAVTSYLSFLPDMNNSAITCLANDFWQVYPQEKQSKFIEIGSLYNTRCTCAIV